MCDINPNSNDDELVHAFMETAMEVEKFAVGDKLPDSLVNALRKIESGIEKHKWASNVEITGFFALGKSVGRIGGCNLLSIASRIGGEIIDKTLAYQVLIAVEDCLIISSGWNVRLAETLLSIIDNEPEIWSQDLGLRKRVSGALKNIVSATNDRDC